MPTILNTLDNNTTSGANKLSAENKTYYDRLLLERLKPELVWSKFAQKRNLPKRNGKTISMRKFNSLGVATTPLTEGVTPDGSALSVSEITATVAQYGDYVKITDELDLMGIDPVLTESVELLGEQAGETLDTLARDVVCAGTNVQYAGGAQSTATVLSTGKISFDEIAKAVATLKRAKIKKIDGSYIGVIDPETAYDIQKDALFQDVSKYNGGVKLMDGEIGKLAGVRFIETTQTKVKDGGIASYVETEDTTYDSSKTYYTKNGSTYTEASISAFAENTTYYEAVKLKIHCVMIIGKDAYGEVDLEGENAKPEVIVKTFGSSGTEDPLNQRSTAGWKAHYCTKRLNELGMVRLECATTLQN